MADLLQNNLALGERLDKHRTRLYNLEKLDIPHKVSQSVDEIVTDAVDWAMQAPLRAVHAGNPQQPYWPIKRIGERLKALDPSTPHYKRRFHHTEIGM
ncbi:hypothetical protein Tco_0663621 [Tanacetum coccineum]